MAHVHVDTVSVRYDELDGFGVVRASAALRWLAQLAADASAAVGFGPEWYDAQGLMWLVRRTTLALDRPMGRGETLSLRTWVEDFRRVRSHRAYEIRDASDRVVGRGRTDWVLIDTGSGRPVRVPAAIVDAFGVPSDREAAERPAWRAPPAPPVPARMEHDVRFADLDSLAHVNNATYLDLLAEGALGAFAGAGWGLDRLRGGGVVPWVRCVDVEYLDAALWGDRLTSTTWLANPSPDLVVYQLLGRAQAANSLVRARADWAWCAPGGAVVPAPPGLVEALAPLVAVG